ncbi:MAG: hypothetical protein GY861_18485 [bacterium]|nr:hypothetical protein [bacterium]
MIEAAILYKDSRGRPGINQIGVEDIPKELERLKKLDLEIGYTAIRILEDNTYTNIRIDPEEGIIVTKQEKPKLVDLQLRDSIGSALFFRK